MMRRRFQAQCRRLWNVSREAEYRVDGVASHEDASEESVKPDAHELTRHRPAEQETESTLGIAVQS